MEIVAILVLFAVAWLWVDSLKAREAAVKAGRNACTAEGLMLLDDTVAIRSLKPARNSDGRVELQRAYDFEYTDNGNNRLHGSIVLLGNRVLLLNVGVRDAPAVRTLH
jgi:hypothetical protein